jgi:chromosome segregation ATPase
VAFTPRFKEKIVTLATLHTNLEPHLAELPQLARDHATLAEVLAELEELESRQDQAKGELRRINRRRDELERQGRNLRHRLRAPRVAARDFAGLSAGASRSRPICNAFGPRESPIARPQGLDAGRDRRRSRLSVLARRLSRPLRR